MTTSSNGALLASGCALPNGFITDLDRASHAPRTVVSRAENGTTFVLRANASLRQGDVVFDDRLLLVFNSKVLAPSTSPGLRSLWGLLQSKGHDSASMYRLGYNAVALLLSDGTLLSRMTEAMSHPAPSGTFDCFGVTNKNDAAVPVGIATMMCKVAGSEPTSNQSAGKVDPLDAALWLLFSQQKGVVLLNADSEQSDQILGLLPFIAVCTQVKLPDAANVALRLLRSPVDNSQLIVRCEALRDLRAGDQIRFFAQRDGSILSAAEADKWRNDLLAAAGSHSTPAADVAEKVTRLLSSKASPEALLRSIERLKGSPR